MSSTKYGEYLYLMAKGGGYKVHILICILLELIVAVSLIWLINLLIKDYKESKSSLPKTILSIILEVTLGVPGFYVTFVIACFLFGIILLFYY